MSGEMVEGQIGQIGQAELEAALPDLTGTVTVQGLEGPVEIVRDRHGAPHVRAGSLHDAFFAQGFVHAQDRLWQMEFDRRRASGRWAELVGKAALDSDVLMRRLDLDASARADYEAFDDETKEMFDAYAAGVNAFIDTTDTLPIEFTLLGIEPQRWEPWQSGAIFKVRHVLMGNWGSKLWRARLLLALGQEMVTKIGVRGAGDGIVIVPPGQEYRAALADMSELMPGIEALSDAPDLGGSNNWAIHGNRTASGKPMTAGDPHRFLDVPNVYYQCHIACPEFDVVGYNFAGIPGFPHFAHNQHVAWCITHAMADYQDLYVERLRTTGDTGFEYEFQGEWRPAEHRRESIVVREGAPVEIDVIVTHHGPVVITGDAFTRLRSGEVTRGYAIAMHYTALDRPNLGLTCLLPQLRATSVEELDATMRNWVDPCNSLTMADVHGTIGYLHRGRVPVRSRANGWLPAPGWSGEHEWEGDIPFEELPRSSNPETGWIATANNRVVGDEYPHYLSLDYAPPYRAMRVAERLSSLTEATMDDMQSIHADRVSIPSRWFVEAVSKIELDDPVAEEARTRLLAWDGVMDKHLVAPTIYSVTRDQLVRQLVGTQFFSELTKNPFVGEPATLGPAARLWSGVITMLRDGDRTLLLENETWDEVLATALTNATIWLTQELGEAIDDWRWERLHRTNPVHPLAGVFPELQELLNPPSVTLGGDADTVQAAGGFPGVGHLINGTSVARYAFDTADWDNSRWVSPLGASGHPGSKHYADQAHDWSEVRMNPMLYSWDRIEAEAETRQVLQPT